MIKNKAELIESIADKIKRTPITIHSKEGDWIITLADRVKLVNLILSEEPLAKLLELLEETREDCSSCLGIGFTMSLLPDMPRKTTCPKCKGSGKGDWQLERLVRRLVRRAKVITLCGSTRFTGEMLVKQWELTKMGNIVHSWCALPDGYFEGEDKTHIGDQEGVKEIVDDVHKRKIDLSDEVFVLNIGGYIGESTRSEINYAESIGVPVTYKEN